MGRHQHALKVAGCSDAAAFGWCSTAGQAQVCFDDGGSCVSLARAASTASQRAALNATCDPSSPLFFKWGPPDGICNFEEFNWVDFVQSDPGTAALAQIPRLATEYWADMQAVLLHTFPSRSETIRAIPSRSTISRCWRFSSPEQAPANCGLVRAKSEPRRFSPNSGFTSHIQGA